jgi:hypothetical protein
MKTHTLATLAALLLLTGCAALDGGGGHDGDKDRSKAEERARKYCVDQAKSRGLRVESVGSIEKVAKKQYEVKLRVAPKNKPDKNDKQDKQVKKGDDRMLCRYDDKNRQAALY